MYVAYIYIYMPKLIFVYSSSLAYNFTYLCIYLYIYMYIYLYLYLYRYIVYFPFIFVGFNARRDPEKRALRVGTDPDRIRTRACLFRGNQASNTLLHSFNRY